MPRTCLALSLVLLLAACSDSSNDTTPLNQPNYDFGPADAWLDSFVQDQDVYNGAAYMVFDRDLGVLHSASFGDKTLDTVYLLASVSKITSVTLLLALHEDPAIDFDIDTPIENYLPWMGVYPGITTAQLLSNTSGIPGLLIQFRPGGYGAHNCQYRLPGEFPNADSLQACGQAIYQTPLDGTLPPGTLFDYGGSQWQLAGAVAESVGGDSWNNLFDRYIGEPCGLTVYEYGNMFSATDAWTGYPDSLLGQENPNIEGGAISNLEDVTTILRMHVNDGVCNGNRVISEAAAQRMRKDVGTALGSREWVGSNGAGYGLGWWIPPAEEGVEPTFFRGGGAFGSAMYIDTARGYGVFVGLAKYDDIIAARPGRERVQRELPSITAEIIDNPLP